MTYKLYTVIETAKILRFSPMTLYKWIREDKIKAVKFGNRSYRIKEKDIKQLLNQVNIQK